MPDQDPRNIQPRLSDGAHRPRFVIQHHESRHPHDDFRLEVAGVFKSWAIPKLFPTHPGERRLAIQTEDHSLDFGDFEGTVPEGHPGAGDICKFDEGWYSPCGDRSIEEQLAAGEASFYLHGHTVRGQFRLTLLRRGRWRSHTNKPEWMIVLGGGGV
jgi:bifunctional non-homologous end joining protein LigD